MEDILNPRTNPAGMVQKYLGEAYQNVRLVAENMDALKRISRNADALEEIAKAVPSMTLFVENPDFLPWLDANKELLEDLSGAVAAISQDVVKQKILSGSLPLAGKTLIIDHGLDVLPENVIGLSGSITGFNNVVYPLGIPGIVVTLDSLNLKITVTHAAAGYAEMDYNILVAYKE